MPSRNPGTAFFVSGQESSPHEAPRHRSSRSSLAGCGSAGARAPPRRRHAGQPLRASTPASSAAVRGPIAHARSPARPRRPPRARLDAEHRPHRVLRRAARGLVPRRRHRPPDPAVRDGDARDPPGGPPGRVRHQLPGLADVCRRRPAPTSRASRRSSRRPPRRSAVLADRPDPAAAGPRRQDVRRLRLPERGADAQGRSSRPTAARATFTVATLDAAAYEALYEQARPTSRSRSRPGRASRPSNAASTCATSSSRTMASPTSTRSSSPAIGSGSRRHPDAARRFVGATRPRLRSSPSTSPTMPPRCSSPRTRVSSTRIRTCHGQASDSSSTAATSSTRPATSATQTLERWTAYSKFLYDQELLTDPNGKPLTAPPDYASLFTNDFLP